MQERILMVKLRYKYENFVDVVKEWLQQFSTLRPIPEWLRLLSLILKKKELLKMHLGNGPANQEKERSKF